MIQLLLAAILLVGPSPDRKAIEAIYVKMAKAMKAKDAGAVVKLETPDFTLKQQDGKKLNSAQAKAKLQESFRNVTTFDTFTISVGSFKVTGKTAVCMTSYSLTMHGMGGDKKTHVVAGTGKERDTLVKTPNGWRLKLAEDLSSSVTVDGRPVHGRAKQ